MTKDRAEERAKKNALKKAKKLLGHEKPNQGAQAGHYNSASHSIKGPGGNNKGNSFSPAKRGSARSS